MKKHVTHSAQQTPPPRPAGGEDNKVTALAGLYQGEKTDASYIFNTAMAMMGLAVAYLVGTIPLLSKLQQGPEAWFLLPLLPSPLWLVVAFHSLITLNAMRHGLSVRIIENALFRESGLPADRRGIVGSAAGDLIMDIGKSKIIHKVATVVVYLGVGLLVISFTVYALCAAPPAGTYVIRVATIIYSFIFAVALWSWIAGLRALWADGKKNP